ncbi:MAG TPA: phosphatase PAP2 family protein [Terracidiphilus sp.]|nr:phosphatase PAP2 family protein [Terracidiphilus sp.]
MKRLQLVGVCGNDFFEFSRSHATSRDLLVKLFRTSCLQWSEKKGGHINPFDFSILQFLDQFARRSAHLDRSIGFLSSDLIFQGGVALAFYWWAWFRNRDTQSRDREYVLSGIAASMVALLVARALALALPYRERPRFAMPDFKMPIGSEGGNFLGWSSFPSDHAVFYFSLATCIFFISRRAGLLAYFHALFFVCLPRIYTGVHYPTDVLVGAILGIGIAYLSLIRIFRESAANLPLRWLRESPSSFYPCFFLASILLASEFDPVRVPAVAAWQLIKAHAHRAP